MSNYSINSEPEKRLDVHGNENSADNVSPDFNETIVNSKIDSLMEENNKPIKSRMRKIFTILILIIIGFIIAIIAGAWGYSAMGFQFFGGPVVDRISVIETRISQLEGSFIEQNKKNQLFADRLDELVAANNARIKDADRLTKLEQGQIDISEKISQLNSITNQSENSLFATNGQASEFEKEIMTLRKQIEELAGQKNSLTGERDILSKDLIKIASALVPVKITENNTLNDSWWGWISQQLAKIYQFKSTDVQFSEDLAQFAREQNIVGAVRLIRNQKNPSQELIAWAERAEAYISREDL